MKAHFKYLRYLLRHKWFVFVAGLRTGAPIWRLVIHDWSKLLPCEWIPYARSFYGGPWRTLQEMSAMMPAYSGPTKDSVRRDFDRAWLHHQHRNPHHWQHWVLREDDGKTKYMEMPEHFAREMVADWMGAGRAITGQWEVWKWYGKNVEHILLNSVTSALVQELVTDERNRMAGELVDA